MRVNHLEKNKLPKNYFVFNNNTLISIVVITITIHAGFGSVVTAIFN